MLDGKFSVLDAIHAAHAAIDAAASASPASPPALPETSSRSAESLLAHEVERLLILTEALWEILKERFEIEDDELVRKMVMVDLRDGKLDGRVAADPPRKCPRCARTLHKKRPRCLYCDEPIPPAPFQR